MNEEKCKELDWFMQAVTRTECGVSEKKSPVDIIILFPRKT